MVLPLAMSEAEALERALEDPEFHREHIVGKPLFWPQVVVAKAIERAMAAREAETICVRSSRQTMKNEVSGLIEARALVRHQHVGGSIVKTAPTYEPQVTTSKHRLEERTAEDPLVEGKIRWREGNIAQYGNAKVQFLSLDKKARIEGATASLLLEVDEAHLTDEKSFEDKAGPMPGFWAAPKVLWGVAGAKQDMLYRRMSHQLGGPPSAGIIQEKNVFQFPASLWCELNPRWAKTYENTRATSVGTTRPSSRSTSSSTSTRWAATSLRRSRRGSPAETTRSCRARARGSLTRTWSTRRSSTSPARTRSRSSTRSR
jgi:hypothetical protein